MLFVYCLINSETEQPIVMTRWSFFRCLSLMAVLPTCACFTWTQEPKRSTEESEAPPAISIHPMNTSITEFTDLLSFCNASGQPRPIITWRRKDKEMMFPPGEFLSLPSVSRDDAGLYECIAKNSAGNKSVEFRINVLYQPTAQVIPGNVTVNQSDTITLTCLTSGNPAPNVTWTTDGNQSVILSDDNKLELDITSKTNEGGYRCTAANGIGLPGTSTAYVFVKHHRPMNTSFISCAPNNAAWVNDGVVFSCSSVSSPSPATYVIYHNGKIIRKNKSGYHKICNVKPRHSGTYICEPRNTFGVGERRSVTFTVYEKPVVFVIPRVLNVTEGSPALFVCSATGSPPPNITWKIMSSGEIYYGEKLEIKAVKRNDAGNYQCTASNGISRPVKDTAFLNVYYKPWNTSLLSSEKSSMIVFDSSVTITCRTKSNPPPYHYTFYKDSVVVQKGTARSFYITQVSYRDQGTYTCAPENILGRGSSAMLNLTVQGPPFVMDGPRNQTVNESEALLLTCNIGGNPPASVSWYHNSNKELTVGRVLFIDHANRSHAGSYRCTASNGFGNPVTSQAYVLVNYKPTVHSGKKNISSWIGHETRILCRVEGFPRPTIHWSGKGVVTDVIISEVTSQSTLTVTPTTQSDFTTYSCYARNNLGYDSRSFVLEQLEHSKKRTTETDNGGSERLSTTMLVCLIAGIGGAILFIVMLSWLVKRCISTGKGSITKE